MSIPVRRWIALAAVLGAVSGCGTTIGNPLRQQAAPADDSPYGRAAPASAEGITYQPDVVVVDGGAGVVRAVSADGLTWTLDAAATGLDGLEPGEVMFLTARAAGRVADLRRDGDAVTVALAPVQLTEVIRDGRLTLDTELDAGDLADATVQLVPDLPGTLGEPTAEETELPRLGHGPLVRLRQDGGGLPTPNRSKIDFSVGDWGVTTAVDAKALTVSLSNKRSENLKLGADITLGYSSLRLAADVVLRAGAVAGSAFTVTGLRYLDLNLHAGAANGVNDNQKVRVEVPAEVVNKGFLVGGVPMVFNMKVKVFAETALTGKNATLTAHGRWGLDGPVGVENGAATSPAFSVITSIMDSISGISLGPSGLVVGAEFRFMLGLGVPGTMGGVYVKLRTSAGVTNGSALSMSIPKCVRADLLIKGGGGVGFAVGSDLLDRISERLPGKPKLKIEGETEYLGTIAERSQTLPQNALCLGS
ncbi:MAG TPA: hypothetical protein VGD67_01135 [Pseudonocardiaceae bacterium]